MVAREGGGFAPRRSATTPAASKATGHASTPKDHTSRGLEGQATAKITLINTKSGCMKTGHKAAAPPAQAEIRAAFSASQLVVYARQFLEELGFGVSGPTVIWEDNDACRTFSTEEMHQSRAKHLEIKMAYLRELILRNVIQVKRVDTDRQRADILTKNAVPSTFVKHVKALMSCNDPNMRVKDTSLIVETNTRDAKALVGG